MKPKVARIAAHIQVAIAIGTVPAAIGVFIVTAPFDLPIAAISAFGVLIAAGGVSSLGIPIVGLVASKMLISRDE